MRLGLFQLLILSAALMPVAMAMDDAMGMKKKRECLTFETYNVGMGAEVPNREQRLPFIINALKKSTSDVLCLQELWMEYEMKSVIDGLASVFPNHYSALHSDLNTIKRHSTDTVQALFGLKQNPCSLSEALRLAKKSTKCAQQNRCNLGTPTGNACLMQNCKKELMDSRLSDSCISCVAMNSFVTTKGAFPRCSFNSKQNVRYNNPGLLVLSKRQINAAVYVNFFKGKKASTERGYIRIHLDNDIEAVCTHLSSVFPLYFEYDLNFGSYKQQQLEEIEKLKTAFMDRDIVLLGDMNMGPKRMQHASEERNLDGDENYEQLLKLGYTSCYAKDDGRCTFCNNNTYTRSALNNIVDHVMIKGKKFSCCDGTKSKTSREYDDKKVEPVLSDHYGVKVQVCKK